MKRAGRGAVVVQVVALVTLVFAMSAGPAWAKDYKVGKKAESGDFLFTVHGYTDPWVSDNQFDTPSPGNHYVVVDVEVKNPSKDQRSFSSLLGFHLYDKANREYDHTISTAEPGPPGGEFPGKSAVRGLVTFEVPDGSPTPLRFRAQGSITASGAYWKLKPPPAPPAG